MNRCATLIAITLMLATTAVLPAQAQTAGDKTAPMTGMKPDRTTADAATRKAMQEKEAALKKKRAECRAKAKAEKVPLLKRAAYVKNCMAQ